jgi:DNA-binding GntR family transcriptional regulator
MFPLIDINEIRCAFEVKKKLEALAGAVAANRITNDRLEELRVLVEKADVLLSEGGHRNLIEIDNSFHEIICQATQNPILQDLHENPQSRCARLWNSALSDITSVQEIVGQLREVYLSLKKRDSEKAAYLLESHVKYFVNLIKNQLL